jgi:hypothetical protein
MGSYKRIDPILMAWAQGRGIHVHTKYRDDAVRSIVVNGPTGEQRHLWIDPSDGDDRVGVHAATSDWRHDRTVPLPELAAALSEIFDLMTRMAPIEPGK